MKTFRPWPPHKHATISPTTIAPPSPKQTICRPATHAVDRKVLLTSRTAVGWSWLLYLPLNLTLQAVCPTETLFGPSRVESPSPTVRQTNENGQTPAKLPPLNTERPMDTIVLQPSDHRRRSTSQNNCHLYPHLYLVAPDNLAVMGWANLWLLVALPRRAR